MTGRTAGENKTMARRYSGRVSIDVVYKDEGYYDVKVKSPEVPRYIFTIEPPASGFGPGVAYDSPEAYDSVAKSAAAFANDKYPELDSELLFSDIGIEITR